MENPSSVTPWKSPWDPVFETQRSQTFQFDYNKVPCQCNTRYTVLWGGLSAMLLEVGTLLNQTFTWTCISLTTDLLSKGSACRIDQCPFCCFVVCDTHWLLRINRSQRQSAPQNCEQLELANGVTGFSQALFYPSFRHSLRKIPDRGLSRYTWAECRIPREVNSLAWVLSFGLWLHCVGSFCKGLLKLCFLSRRRFFEDVVFADMHT